MGKPTVKQILDVGQYALVGAALMAIALIPDEEGFALVVPIAPTTDGGTIAWALRADARLTGKGPWPGSVVVWGRRSNILAGAFANGALAVRATGADCSDEAGDRAGRNA